MSDTDTIARTQIDSSIGPSPWYWGTFPSLRGSAGTAFRWTNDDADGPAGGFVALTDEQSRYRLLLGNYCRPFTANGYLGLWFPDAGSARLVSFDPELLPVLPRPVRFLKLGLQYHAGIAPGADFLIPAGLKPGPHKIELPHVFAYEGELLLVLDYRNADGSDVPTVISLFPPKNELRIFPQEWFLESYGGGWEWITRVTRHPTKGTLIGDGIRIRAFELTQDGCQLARWL